MHYHVCSGKIRGKKRPSRRSLRGSASPVGAHRAGQKRRRSRWESNPPAAAADDDRERRRPRARRRGVPRGEWSEGHALRDEGGGQGQEHDPVQDGALPGRPARDERHDGASACRRLVGRARERRAAATRAPTTRARATTTDADQSPRAFPTRQAKNLDADLTEMANVFMESRCATREKRRATAAKNRRRRTARDEHPSRARSRPTRARPRSHSSKPDTALPTRVTRAHAFTVAATSRAARARPAPTIETRPFRRC